MLPHLGALAGGEINDRASEVILLAIGDLSRGREGRGDVQADSLAVKDFCPIREVGGPWIRV